MTENDARAEALVELAKQVAKQEEAIRMLARMAQHDTRSPIIAMYAARVSEILDRPT